MLDPQQGLHDTNQIIFSHIDTLHNLLYKLHLFPHIALSQTVENPWQYPPYSVEKAEDVYGVSHQSIQNLLIMFIFYLNRNFIN